MNKKSIKIIIAILSIILIFVLIKFATTKSDKKAENLKETKLKVTSGQNEQKLDEKEKSKKLKNDLDLATKEAKNLEEKLKKDKNNKELKTQLEKTKKNILTVEKEIKDLTSGQSEQKLDKKKETTKRTSSQSEQKLDKKKETQKRTSGQNEQKLKEPKREATKEKSKVWVVDVAYQPAVTKKVCEITQKYQPAVTKKVYVVDVKAKDAVYEKEPYLREYYWVANWEGTKIVKKFYVEDYKTDRDAWNAMKAYMNDPNTPEELIGSYGNDGEEGQREVLVAEAVKEQGHCEDKVVKPEVKEVKSCKIITVKKEVKEQGHWEYK